MSDSQSDSGEEQPSRRNPEWTDSSTFSSLDFHDRCSSEESLYTSTLNKLMLTVDCKDCALLDLQAKAPKLVKQDQNEMQVDDADAVGAVGLNGADGAQKPTKRSIGVGGPSLLIPLRSDADLIAYTGINFDILNKLEEAVDQCESQAANYDQIKELGLDSRNRIILCLSKIKLNIEFQCISIFFGIRRDVCAMNFYYMVRVLAKVLKKDIYWPTRDEIKRKFPTAFTGLEDARVFLVSQRLRLEKSRCSNCRTKLASYYDLSNSVKVLIGVAPTRQVSFMSQAFSGKESKKSMFLKSGILKMLEPKEDAVVVDKRFDIKSECMENNVKLLIPPRLGERSQYSTPESNFNALYKDARFYIKHTIKRWQRWKIIQNEIPWILIPFIDDILTVTGALVNLQDPTWPDDDDDICDEHADDEDDDEE